MKSLTKGVFLFVLVSAVIMPNFGSAATAEELQAQIQALLQELQNLQQQLAQVQGGTPQWCHTFNTNLKIGDQGDEVSNLVTALNKEGLLNGKTDTYDEEVAAAVTGFQEKYRDEILTPVGLKYGTGYVGKSTRAKLNRLYGCVVPPISQPNYDATPTNIDLAFGNTYTFKAKITNAPVNASVYFYLQRPDGTMKYNGQSISDHPTTDFKGSWQDSIEQTIAANSQLGAYVSWFVVGDVITNKIYHYLTNSSVQPSQGTLYIQPSNFSVQVGKSQYVQAMYQWSRPFTEVPPPGPTAVEAQWASSNESIVLVQQSPAPGMPCMPSGQGCSYTPSAMVTGVSAGTAEIKAYYYPSIAAKAAGQVVTAKATVTVVASTGQPSIQVLSPNGGEQWGIGTTQTIRWSSGGTNGIGIFLQANAAGAATREIARLKTNTGLYAWTVPSDLEVGPYIIKICATVYNPEPTCLEPIVSSQIFSIILSNIILLSPNGGEIPSGPNNFQIRYSISNFSSLTQPHITFRIYQNGTLLGSRCEANDNSSGTLCAVSPDSQYWNFSWEVGSFVDSTGYHKAGPGSGFTIQALLYDGTKLIASALSAPFSIVAAPTTQSNITVALDSSTPPSTTVTPGQTNVTFAKIRLTAGSSDVNSISSIQVGSDSSLAGGYLQNIKVYDGATQVGTAITQLALIGSYYQNGVYPPSGWTIPANNSKVLTIVADVPSAIEKLGGSVHLGVVQLMCGSSGTCNTQGVPTFGNNMTVSTGKLNISSSPLGLTSNRAPFAVDDIANLTFTAGGSDITVMGLNLNLGGTALANNQSFAVDLIDPLTGITWGGASYQQVSNCSQGCSAGFRFYSNPVISAGTSKTVKVRVNSLGFAAGGQLTIQIRYTTDLSWVSNGITGANDSAVFPFTIANASYLGGTIVSSITVLSPNGGEKWTQGTNQVVTWSSSNIPSSNNVSFALRYFYPDGVNSIDYGLTTTVGNTAPNTGSATVMVPNVLPAGTASGSFKLFISTAVSGSAVSDWSGAPFSIVAPAPGTLNVSLDSSSPPASYISVGGTGIVFAKISLTASGGDVNNINVITVGSDSNNAYSYFNNIKVYDGATQIGNTVTMLGLLGSSGYNYYTNGVLLNNLSIPVNTSKILTLVADIPSSVSSTTSVPIRLGIVGMLCGNGGACSTKGLPVFGNTMTIAIVPPRTGLLTPESQYASILSNMKSVLEQLQSLVQSR